MLKHQKRLSVVLKRAFWLVFILLVALAIYMFLFDFGDVIAGVPKL